MFRRLGIAQRIYGSFGLLIALLAVVCVAAYLGLTSIIGLLDDFRGSSRAAAAVSNLASEVSFLQQAALKYRVSYAKTAAAGFDIQLSEIRLDDPALLETLGGDPATKVALGVLKTQVGQFANAFHQSVKLNEDRSAQVTAMRDTGAKAVDAMNGVLQGAAQLYDMKMTTQAAQSATALQSMLTFAERYLVGASAADYKGLQDQGAAASTAVDQMAQHLFNPDLKAKAQSASTLLHGYLDMSSKLKTTVDQLAQVETTSVDQIGTTISSRISGLEQQISNKQNTLGMNGQAAASHTLMLLIGAGVAALLIGAALAFLLGRSLSNSIRGMARSMRQLAEGDLDAELSGKASGRELGQMAEALEVFRANGRAVRDMDALKAEEARQAADVQAQREAVLGDVQQVVASALAGDFSGRIDEANATDDLRDFVASLNSVMATVEQGVEETGAVLDGIAGNDLSQRVEGNYDGVFGRLRDATNTAADKFADVVQRLQDASGALREATREMVGRSDELSERTTRQAATIEETSAAMEQLSGTVTNTANRANEASKKTQAASALADEGGEVMKRASDAMERITTASGKISNIIAMIDDIAFQTNLLALNASVEAARAGEAGKGFAVVAVEVRRLAQSAASASGDVKKLIEQSGNEVSNGTRLVAQAEAKLTAILAAVRENSGLMGAISEATHGQASAIAEVNTAVRTMDEMTQHNAALVDQNNATIQRAEAQAGELDAIVAAFRVDAGDEMAEDDMDDAIAAAEEMAAGEGIGSRLKRAMGLGRRTSAA